MKKRYWLIWILIGLVPIFLGVMQQLVCDVGLWALLLWIVLELNWIFIVVSYKAERDEKKKAKQ